MQKICQMHKQAPFQAPKLERTPGPKGQASYWLHTLLWNDSGIISPSGLVLQHFKEPHVLNSTQKEGG